MEIVIVFNKTTGNTSVNGEDLKVKEWNQRPFTTAKFNKVLELMSHFISEEESTSVTSRTENKATKEATVVVNTNYETCEKFLRGFSNEIHDLCC